MSFIPARPIGCRASGGKPTNVFIHEDCRPELQQFFEGEFDPQIPPASMTVLRERVRYLVGLLRSGRLRFDGADPLATVIERHDCIYELRPRPAGRRLSTRELRLYCGEPKIVENLVLALHLASKPGNESDVMGEQDQAIDTAVGRGESWEIGQLKPQGRVR